MKIQQILMRLITFEVCSLFQLNMREKGFVPFACRPWLDDSFSLDQCFLNFFTYLTLLSNKITTFTPNTPNVAICWKCEINKLLQFGMIYKNLNKLQFMFQ